MLTLSLPPSLPPSLSRRCLRQGHHQGRRMVHQRVHPLHPEAWRRYPACTCVCARGVWACVCMYSRCSSGCLHTHTRMALSSVLVGSWRDRSLSCALFSLIASPLRARARSLGRAHTCTEPDSHARPVPSLASPFSLIASLQPSSPPASSPRRSALRRQSRTTCTTGCSAPPRASSCPWQSTPPATPTASLT